MAAKFPHRYQVALDWKERSQGELSAAPKPPILGGPPPEFGGQASWWSPEHLLLSATSLCLMTTFEALASREKLQLISYHCDAEGVLEKTSQGIVFTSITLSVKLVVPPDEVARAEQTLQTAERYCIVSNSLKAPVTLRAEVLPAQGQATPEND